MFLGAEDEAQTRDPQLGRLMLYQLSYFRIIGCGRRWIRTTEGINQQIYSLPHLATLVFALISFLPFQPLPESVGASCRIRTNDPEITNHVLWPTELKRRVLLLFCLSLSPRCGPKSDCKVTHFFHICKHLEHFFVANTDFFEDFSSFHTNTHLIHTVFSSADKFPYFFWLYPQAAGASGGCGRSGRPPNSRCCNTSAADTTAVPVMTHDTGYTSISTWKSLYTGCTV